MAHDRLRRLLPACLMARAACKCSFDANKAAGLADSAACTSRWEGRSVHGIPLRLLGSQYIHVADSDGTVTVKDADAYLMFDPSGSAFILAALPRTMMAREGWFRVDDGTLAMHFSDGDFARECSIPLDLARATMTLPFKLFSAGAGSSTWRLQVNGLAVRSYAIYNAFLAARGLSEKAAIAPAATYARAFETQDLDAESPGRSGAGAEAETSTCKALEPSSLSKVSETSSGLSFEYVNGPNDSIQFITRDNRDWTVGSSFHAFAWRPFLERLRDFLWGEAPSPRRE
jgi:hypothetical protein